MYTHTYLVRGSVIAGMNFSVALGLCAQNRVPNADFETLSGPCIGIADYTGELASWSIPGCAGQAPSYYHPCSGDNGFPYFSSPANNMGYQEAHSGVAYVGLHTYAWGDVIDPECFLTTHLNEPLYEGDEYCLSLQVSLADRSSFTSGSLHCMFTAQPPSMCAEEDSLVWPTAAQIVLPLATADTSNWTELTGSFVADGVLEYMTIGSLCTNTNCDTTFLGWNGLPLLFLATYYVDDVVLYDCEVGGSELKGQELTVFPNPATQQITIQFPQVPRGEVLEVVNSMGQVIHSLSINTTRFHIDVRGWDAGMYGIGWTGSPRANYTRVLIHE